MKKGKLIVVEGACDGVGKTTQCNLLRKKMEEAGFGVVKYHFPSCDAPQGDGVKKYLEGKFGQIKELSPYFINGLYAYDRAVTWLENLRYEYEAGNVILLDRYTTSSLIYQSALIESEVEKKKFVDYVMDFEYNKLGIKEPDLVLFLYVPFEIAVKNRETRKSESGIIDDIHERDMCFMKRVYDNSLFVAEYLGWKVIRCDDGENMKPVEEINFEMYNACILDEK